MGKSNRNNGDEYFADEAEVLYTQIHNGQLPNEYIVTLEASNGPVNTILQSDFIDQLNQTISGVVISQDDERYLVDLPTYTFTTGSKVWFPRSSVRVKSGR